MRDVDLEDEVDDVEVLEDGVVDFCDVDVFLDLVDLVERKE